MTVTAYKSRDETRPCQGAIYRDIGFIIAQAGVEETEMTEFFYPYAISLTQECDLEQDHRCRNGEKKEKGKHDKQLPMILMCPAYPAAQFRTGEHLKNLGLDMEHQDSKQWKLIKQNNNLRYHYLSPLNDLQIPELIIDFKHFFTIPTELLLENYCDEKSYFASLDSLYREDLSQRFASYLARVGLPIPHHILTKAAVDAGID